MRRDEISGFSWRSARNPIQESLLLRMDTTMEKSTPRLWYGVLGANTQEQNTTQNGAIAVHLRARLSRDLLATGYQFSCVRLDKFRKHVHHQVSFVYIEVTHDATNTKTPSDKHADEANLDKEFTHSLGRPINRHWHAICRPSTLSSSVALRPSILRP